MAAVVVLLLSTCHGQEMARAVAETSETIAAAGGDGVAIARIKNPSPSAAAPKQLPLPGALATTTQAALLATKAHEGAVKLVAGGGETTLGGLPAYLAALPKSNATAAAAPKSAIVLYSDIYGYRGNGTRLWADRLASLGYVAVVPDFFQGRSAAPGPTQAEDRAFIIALPKSNVTRQAGSVISDLKKKYPSIRKVAAYGFCWGGRYAAVVAGSGAGPAAADAAVSYHAALIAPDEFAAITRPVLFVNAAGDPMFNATIAAEAEKAAARNAKASPRVEVALKSYDGVKHGFAVRAMPNDTVAVAAAESAFQDGLAFLKKQGVTP
jgi:dienelactone hydrolase